MKELLGETHSKGKIAWKIGKHSLMEIECNCNSALEKSFTLYSRERC